MGEDEFPREDELEERQDAALYPVGRALRTTFDAENHDSLTTDITGLMLELAHIDPDAQPLPRPALPPLPVEPEQAAVAPPESAAPALSWWRVAWNRLVAG